MDHETPRVLYAPWEEGEPLPIVDVTHPAFRLDIDPARLDAEMERAVQRVQAHQSMPSAQQHAHMEDLLRGSILAPRIAAARGTFLDGMSTYLLKLGPDQLGPRASEMDRAIAASMPSLSCRLRLQDMAHLAAQELAEVLPLSPGAPLWMVNIAGGPGMDSLNALIVLQRAHPGLLDGHATTIWILDVDEAGPRFGAGALEVMRAGGGPLEGLSITCRYARFDWTRPAGLRECIPPSAGTAPVIACSSEGGLFDYASDQHVVEVLAELDGLAGRAFAVGSISRGDGMARVLNEAGQAAIRLRSLEQLADLVGKAGWQVTRCGESPLSREVVMKPRAR